MIDREPTRWEARVEPFSAVRRTGQVRSTQRGSAAQELQCDVDRLDTVEGGNEVERMPGGEIGGPVGVLIVT